MALVNSAFTVNVTPGAMPPVVHVSEYDVGRTYTVTINGENGNAFNIPTGTTATVEGTLNESVGFTQSATISNNQVSFALSESMTAYSGKAWCKIKLTLNDEPIQTCAFVLAVDRAGVEAETVIGASGFEEQINQGVAAWLNEHGASGLPPGGEAGQVLVSDGHGGGVWVDWGGGSSVIEFDDRNEYVLGYLTASENYTAANRATVSVIGQYASSSIDDQDAPEPYQGVYNLMPGEETTIGSLTVKRKETAPRMLKLENVWNVRDIGGWACDGGKVKYGMLFRGARLENATADDLALLSSLGIKLDLDIRDTPNASRSTRIPGADYRNIPLTKDYGTMIQTETANAVAACAAAMESVVDGKPVYIHCASGADRTGTICGLLEAVLGMSDKDIDRDFELTCFSDVEPLGGHIRNGAAWTGLWSALDLGQGSAKMNVVKFLRDNGVTTALINAFRRAMTDGNPSDVDIPTYTVTNRLTGCTTSNSAASVDGGSAYAATLTPNSGYSMTLLTVTMGGTDITSTAVSGNTITIAEVTGAIVITAFAEQPKSYTNLVKQATAFDSDEVFNLVGYQNGYYKPGGADANACLIGCIPYVITSAADPTDVLYIKGYTGAANANHTRMWTRRADKTGISEYYGVLSTNPIFNIEVLGADYYKLTPKNGVHHNFNNVAYLNFSFAQPDGANIVITRNEPID